MYGHRKRVCIESWLWEKNPLRTGESNLRRRRAGPMLYQLSYIPSPRETHEREERNQYWRIKCEDWNLCDVSSRDYPVVDI